MGPQWNPNLGEDVAGKCTGAQGAMIRLAFQLAGGFILNPLSLCLTLHLIYVTYNYIVKTIMYKMHIYIYLVIYHARREVIDLRVLVAVLVLILLRTRRLLPWKSPKPQGPGTHREI